jgi:solute carrier family 25 (mitochondrial 2-oxodicarboxylate transporter), member 21
LATGLAPTLWRNCVWNAIYYGTMHRLEQHFDEAEENKGGGGGGGEGECAGGSAGAAARRAARQLACGFGVGVFATLFNAPFDVVKSRFQAQLPEGIPLTAVPTTAAAAAAAAAAPTTTTTPTAPPPAGAAARYSGVFPTLVRIARDEGGPRALYRGFVPKALRLGIGQTVGLAAFQSILDAAGVRERDAPAAVRRLEEEARAEVVEGS